MKKERLKKILKRFEEEELFRKKITLFYLIRIDTKLKQIALFHYFLYI